MYYYFVWVRSGRYHGRDALTYAYPSKLPTGSIVAVELQKEMVMGVITGPTAKPRFQTKEIARTYDLPPLPVHLVRLGLWLQQYYPAPLGAVTQQILPAKLSEKQLAAPAATALPPPDLAALPKLTQEQTVALAAMEERGTFVLHGATGSGKTRVYIEMAAHAIEAGQSAIILTPEISLTSQLASNFRQVFGQRVVVMHSGQTPSERQQAWLTCLQAHEPLIVVGPRSALFCPIQKIGLIVLDEAHEAAYKQDQAPHYHAARVAGYLAQLQRAQVVLGSATPAITDFFLAEQKNKSVVTMTRLAKDNTIKKPVVSLVDRKQQDLFSRSPYLSLELIKAVEAALKNGEQSLLYLNRRGTARLVMCENCGWQATCPHCDLPLTYHGDGHQLRCHSCSYQTNAPSSCPACKHPNVVFKTAGTKAIVDEAKRLFPGARIGRFDTDNTKAERFEQHYEDVRDGKIDILVGTQLLAKGLDLPKLSVLGILLADTSLYLPDFSAQERTYQLISQVLGRIGRGHVAGRAIIQTYHPEHPILKDAIEDNYKHMYETELAARQEFMFPPFCFLLKLTARRATSKSAETTAQKLRDEIESGGYRVRVEGPAPAFYERFQSKYQWQLIVKARERSELLKIIANLPANWSYDIDPLDLL